MTDGFATGDDEKSFVEIGAQRLRAHRRAEGEFDGFDVYAGVYPVIDDDGLGWEVYARVRSDIGKEDLARQYQSRGDAYRAFEYLVDKHDLEEESDEDSETVPGSKVEDLLDDLSDDYSDT